MQLCCQALFLKSIAEPHMYAAMQISIEDFRQMTESVGMQLDDDSLLALFSRVCFQCCPRLCEGCSVCKTLRHGHRSAAPSLTFLTGAA